MIKVNVLSEDKSWTKKIKKRKFFLIIYVSFFQKNFNLLIKKFILTLLLSNNKNIKKLNKKFRNKK